MLEWVIDKRRHDLDDGSARGRLIAGNILPCFAGAGAWSVGAMRRRSRP